MLRWIPAVLLLVACERTSSPGPAPQPAPATAGDATTPSGPKQATPPAPVDASAAAPAAGRPRTKEELIATVIDVVAGGGPIDRLHPAIPKRDEVLDACPAMRSEPGAVADIEEDIAEAPAKMQESVAECRAMLDWRTATRTEMKEEAKQVDDCPGVSNSVVVTVRYQAGGKSVLIAAHVLQLGAVWLLGKEPVCGP